MDFKTEMQKLSVQILERKNHITNEEMTKQALIIPFLQKLGFDVFNPLEVRPEYVADFGIKKGEKVDYAIYKNGVPIIFIEAKPVTEELHKHDAQLSRYFNCTPEVKIAILTNGMEYRFYTDLNQENIMDSQPFFSLNMASLSSVDIEAIENFTKDKFDVERIVKYAEELIYMSNLNSTLKELFKNPSDDFLRFLIKDFSNTRITSNVLDRFRPIVKKAISNTLLEIISEGLSPKESIEEAAIAIETTEEIVMETPRKKGINTTEEELKAFEIILEILNKHGRDTSKVAHKDTTAYFLVYQRVITSWVVRLVLETNRKSIITRLSTEKLAELCPGFVVSEAPKGHGISRVIISSIDDLYKFENLILQAFDESDIKTI
ncbi:type I restriction enzyme HsdR N-terminal domain-containing protein [Aneurinibacillus sp. BA2021]|nr:type I restriction enzyme HsdR N-terminal domain-containing protein [Aneurinibacillus sp. BA2021]